MINARPSINDLENYRKTILICIIKHQSILPQQPEQLCVDNAARLAEEHLKQILYTGRKSAVSPEVEQSAPHAATVQAAGDGETLSMGCMYSVSFV